MVTDKRYVLVVHHDADLYGADQSLYLSLLAMLGSEFLPIVVLPRHGPLVKLLEKHGIETHVGPVGKLERRHLKMMGLPSLLSDLFTTIRFIDKVVSGRVIAMTYSNSLAILGGGLWSRWRRIPHLWHVREIVLKPRAAAIGFPWALKMLSDWAVCNSNSTRRWLTGVIPSLEKKSSVIWNGLGDIPVKNEESVKNLRDVLRVGEHDLLVCLVGRINRLKGHNVLVDAVSLLKKAGRTGLKFVMFGDAPPGQDHYLEQLKQHISTLGLTEDIRIMPFTSDVWTVWHASQIAVVPSTEPESFGRVVIEAMACGVPVVATNHGGPAEIVEEGATGYLVKPGDAQALAEGISKLQDDAALRERFGHAGRDRQRTLFSQAQHDAALLNTMRRVAFSAT